MEHKKEEFLTMLAGEAERLDDLYGYYLALDDRESAAYYLGRLEAVERVLAVL